jgi:branched-chain amino acid transport system substrate-binding protein
MKISRLIVLSIIILILLLPLSISCSANQTGDTTNQETKTLEIGVIVEETGLFAAVGKADYDSIQATQTLLNRHGGVTIDGQKYDIELVPIDNQSSAEGAVTAMNTALQRGIKLVVLGNFPPANIAASTVAQKNKMLVVTVGAIGNMILNASTPYTFYGHSTTTNIVPAYNQLVKNYPDKTKIALVYPDDPETTFYTEMVKKEVNKLGLEIVSEVLYPEQTTQDYTPFITKALASNPDALDLAYCIPPWGSSIIKGARDLGFNGPIFGSMLGDINLLNGMLRPTDAHDIWAIVVDASSPDAPPLIRELKDIMVNEEGYKDVFQRDNTIALESAYIIIEGVKAAQSTDATEVVHALDNMKTIDTIYGKGYMSGMDMYGINHCVIRPFPLSSLNNGVVDFQMLPLNIP